MLSIGTPTVGLRHNKNLPYPDKRTLGSAGKYGIKSISTF